MDLFPAAAIIFVLAFSPPASALDFVSVGTNYNLQGYHYYSNGWLQAAPCQTYYPNISISSQYAYGAYLPPCADGGPQAYYRLPELKPPLPYSYLGFTPYLPKYPHTYPSGSAAKAYYAAPAQVHLNAPASSTYPPGFYGNSFNAAASYGNLQEQQYYLGPSPAYASDSAGYAGNEKISFQQVPYAYPGERWLEQPNYWYDSPIDESRAVRTSSTFPPSFFPGYYASAKPQNYYNSFQANEPVKQLAYAGKKALLVMTGSTPAPQTR